MEMWIYARGVSPSFFLLRGPENMKGHRKWWRTHSRHQCHAKITKRYGGTFFICRIILAMLFPVPSQAAGGQQHCVIQAAPCGKACTRSPWSCILPCCAAALPLELHTWVSLQAATTGEAVHRTKWTGWGLEKQGQWNPVPVKVMSLAVCCWLNVCTKWGHIHHSTEGLFSSSVC